MAPPSVTARRVAILRAAHAILDEPPLLLDDPVIGRLLGPDSDSLIRASAERLQEPPARGLRSHVLLRSRFAEDSLADAVASGVRQYLLLGAGLDTFAYRQPEWAAGLSIVEVDRPATQAEKLHALEKAGIAVPPNVRFAGIDFETETLGEGLARNGVTLATPTFVSWLGVTMYLTNAAINAVLASIVRGPASSGIVLTFASRRARTDPQTPTLAERAGAVGEPWISYFTPHEMHALLARHGFTRIEFLNPATAIARYYAVRHDDLPPPRRTTMVRAFV